MRNKFKENQYESAADMKSFRDRFKESKEREDEFKTFPKELRD
jgi:hypothetical protein